MIFKAAPNNDNHLLHKLEYQFFNLECMCVFGVIGVVSLLSSGELVDVELEPPCKTTRMYLVQRYI